MRKSIATVSLSGLLHDKLRAAAGAGFDGIEVFDNDLVASLLSPREVAARCADLGLAVELFQPVRDVEGVEPARFDDVLRRFRAKLAVAGELGAGVVLVCSNASAEAVDDLDLTAEQLHRLGEAAAEHGVRLAYEALAWGRHVRRLGQAWDAVQRADHPAVTLAVDTFHVLSHGDGPEVLEGVPGHRIGFLQVADAPLLDMGLLEWSRHHRCFPGEGTLDVAGLVAATLDAGYDGPLSLEVFSDLVRESDPTVTARDALRSLVFLEDQVGRSDQPAPPTSVDPAFVEVTGSPVVPGLLESLGFRPHGRHRTKPVTWWRNGGADVVVNDGPSPGPALGVVATPVDAVAARASALGWPAVDRTRGAGEAHLPGITTPAGLHVFVSDDGGEDDWHRDFEPDAPSEEPEPRLLALDHVVLAVPPERVNEQVSFLRTVFDLRPGPVEEFMQPHGRLRSRAFRPASGALRVVLNTEDVGADRTPSAGVTQVAFSCRDVRAQVRALRAAGVPLMPVPDNYYVDLDARFGLSTTFLDDLREHHLLFDRIGEGELLHAFTDPLAVGFHVELLERRGGYDAYGSAATHVRLAMQGSGRG